MTPIFNSASLAIDYVFRQVNPEPIGIHAMDFEKVVFEERLVINDYGLVINLRVFYLYGNQICIAEAYYTNSDD